MSYTIERFANEPILLVSLNRDFDFATEAEKSAREAIAILENSHEQLYYISDVSKVHFDMDETIKGSSMAARGENPLFHHPKVKKVILITGDTLQEMTAQGLTSSTFGNTNIITFKNLNEALNYVRNNR